MCFDLWEFELCVVGVHFSNLFPCWSAQHLGKATESSQFVHGKNRKHPNEQGSQVYWLVARGYNCIAEKLWLIKGFKLLHFYCSTAPITVQWLKLKDPQESVIKGLSEILFSGLLFTPVQSSERSLHYFLYLGCVDGKTTVTLFF